jgi:aminoglycoside phosphotransferase (APT) family kinase protein
VDAFSSRVASPSGGQGVRSRAALPRNRRQGSGGAVFHRGRDRRDAKPWPTWVYASDTLDAVADWARQFHEAVQDYEPSPDAVWRFSRGRAPHAIVGHNDAAPYNAVWRDGRLAAFIDWELAAPVTREWDLAFVAFSWVPLHARSVVEPEGFRDFAGRPGRLKRFLARYGWEGDPRAFIDTVRERAMAMAEGLRSLAASGDPDAARLVAEGHADDSERAAAELSSFVPLEL